MPAAEHRVAQTVGLINAWGRTPVIVLTPLRPGFARSLGEPWTRMHRMVVDFLSSLAPTHRLDLIDASSIATFGGTSSAFYDGVHMKVGNVRRLVGYVVDHARMNLGRVP